MPVRSPPRKPPPPVGHTWRISRKSAGRAMTPCASGVKVTVVSIAQKRRVRNMRRSARRRTLLNIAARSGLFTRSPTRKYSSTTSGMSSGISDLPVPGPELGVVAVVQQLREVAVVALLERREIIAHVEVHRHRCDARHLAPLPRRISARLGVRIEQRIDEVF